MVHGIKNYMQRFDKPSGKGKTMVKFVTDSSCDINSYEGTNIEVAPLRIYTDEKDFVDVMDMDVHEMLDYLRDYKGRSYTACPSVEQWLDAYKGGEEIYVITMTSKLSGTYNSACAAKELFLETNPEAKICIVDSLTTGPEMRLAMEKMIEWKKAGWSFEDISGKINAYVASTRLFFAFKSLHNFAQNGRVNKLVATAIETLNISITGTASEGDIKPMHKCRGTKSVLNRIVENLKNAGFNGGKLRICHIENEDLANQLGKLVVELFPKTNLKIYPARGLCSYYGERGGIIIGCEGNEKIL